MTFDPKEAAGEKPLRIRRGKVDSVDLYEIKDSELDLLGRGSETDLYLNFAIFLLSLAFAALASLATADFKSTTVKTLFEIVLVVGILGGSFLTILWCKTRKSRSAIVTTIRKRMPLETADDATGNPPQSAGVEKPNAPTEPRG